MSIAIEAVYEDGVLKPRSPLPLQNKEQVRITVEQVTTGAHSILDIPPVSVGTILSFESVDGDLLDEMLEGRAWLTG